ncbi:hypothetical protein F4782DRAFT_453155 [Xylaria castorea]|nr:hypothetical protein F4782DRAFT_453155 [Xylaria castorea]
MPSYEPATRAQALALKIGGRHSNEEIERITGFSASSVNRLVDRAIERGLDLNKPVILDLHVANGPRSGRPSKQAEAKDQIIAKAQRDRDGREKTCALIAAELDGQVSAMTGQPKKWKLKARELPQAMTQAWIERIVRHSKEVIQLEGGTEYKEGREPSKPLKNISSIGK